MVPSLDPSRQTSCGSPRSEQTQPSKNGKGAAKVTQIIAKLCKVDKLVGTITSDTCTTLKIEKTMQPNLALVSLQIIDHEQYACDKVF